MNPPVVQQPPNISSDGFFNVTLPADSTELAFNLTGLNVFTNYTVHMTVSADGVDNAPIEDEILSRTNTSRENLYMLITQCLSVFIVYVTDCGQSFINQYVQSMGYNLSVNCIHNICVAFKTDANKQCSLSLVPQYMLTTYILFGQ